MWDSFLKMLTLSELTACGHKIYIELSRPLLSKSNEVVALDDSNMKKSIRTVSWILCQNQGEKRVKIRSNQQNILA